LLHCDSVCKEQETGPIRVMENKKDTHVMVCC
jgi:hypothetical protein